MATDSEARVRKTLEILERTGAFVDPSLHDPEALQPADSGVAAPGGCFVAFTRLFYRAPPRATRVATSEGAAPAPTKKTKLARAYEAVQARTVELRTRMDTLRAAAASQMRAGDRKQALMSMKRAKLVQMQMERTEQAALMLEQQVDMLESAQVNSAVTQALSLAVKQSRKSSKGLLSRAENAADGAAELADLSADMASVLGEIGAGTNECDDDELMEELNALLVEGGTETSAAEAPAPVAAAVVAKLPSVPAHGPVVPVPEGSVLLGQPSV